MKRISVAVTILLTCLFAAQNAAAAPAYLRSANGQPWSKYGNEFAMQRVFGAGNWSYFLYETVDAAELFSETTDFVFLEGGDDNALALERFILTHLSLIESWVADGGRLFINAAPNVGDGMPFGFGVQLYYAPGGYSCSIGAAVDPAHPIFNGPFMPVVTEYRGDSFCHAKVRSLAITPLIATDGGFAALGEMQFGAGLALFGSMTTPNFHRPEQEAHNLRANIIAYAAAVVPTDSVSLESFAAQR